MARSRKGPTLRFERQRKENLSEPADCLATGSGCRGSFRGRRRASRRKMQPLGASNGRGMLPAGSRSIGKQTGQAHQEICQWKVSTIGPATWLAFGLFTPLERAWGLLRLYPIFGMLVASLVDAHTVFRWRTASNQGS